MSIFGTTFYRRAKGSLQSFRSVGYPLATLGFLALIGWFGLGKIEYEVKQELSDQLTLILNTNVSAVKSWIESRKSEITSWIADKEIHKELLDLIALSSRDPSVLLPSRELTRLRERLAPLCKHLGFPGFVVFDKSGTQIGALYDEPVGKNPLIALSDFVRRSLQGETVVSHPFRAEIPLPNDNNALKHGQPTMFASTPIRKGGEIVGVFAFRLNPAEFMRILESARSGETGETYAFDHTGLLLSDSRFNDHLRSERIIPNHSDSHAILTLRLTIPAKKSTPKSIPNPSEKETLTRMARLATSGLSGIDVNGYLDYRGIPVVGAWTWLREYGFGVATEIDSAEAFKTLTSLRTLFLLLYMLLALFTISSLILRQREIRAKESLQLILNSAGEGIYGLDAKGYFTFINPAAERMLSYTAKEIVGKHAHNIIHHSKSNGTHYPSDQCPIYKAFRDGLAHQESNDVFWRKDNTCFPVEYISTPIFNDRKLTGAVVTFNDITEQKTLEAKRKQTRQIMQIFIEHNPAPVAMFDRDMRYLAFSRRWLEDYGLGSKNIAGLSHYEVFPEISENWKEIHQRCLAGASEKCDENKLVRQDGTIEWVSWEITPWHDEQGLIGGIIMFTEVITERKLAKDLISRSARIMDNSFDEIYVFDSETLRFSHVSLGARKNLGYSMEELARLTPLDLKSEFSRKDLEALVEPLQLGIKNLVVFEARHKRKDGTCYPLEVRLQILHMETPPQFLAIAHDITERKKAEKKIKDSSELEQILKKAQSKYLTETNFSEVFSELLGKALSLTESEFGFIGEVFFNTDGSPYLKTQALTNIAWNDDTRELYIKHMAYGLEFNNMDTLFGAVITSGRPVIANDPASDPRSGGTPKGHPPLKSFLGLPFHYGGQLVGMVGMANRAEKYNEDIVAFLWPFQETCTNLIQAYRNDKQRKQAEAMLQSANEYLDNRIRERTAELLSANEKLRQLSRAAEQSPSSIIITNTAGDIEYVNPKFTRLSGYEPEEVLGKNSRILKSGKTTPSEYADLWQTITSGGEWHGEFQNIKKNGECYWGSASISSIKDAQGKITHFISSMEDITERKLVEEKLKISLLEKETLLREISHRAKNNMQVISSLIKMQSRDSGEPRLTTLMTHLGNRIAAMSLVHDQILQSKDLNRIDTARYINNLTSNILASYGENNGRITLRTDTSGISLNVETCVHCGLIINELVSNALKHAFAPEQAGTIAVALRYGEGKDNLELIVQDNGGGVKEDFDIHQTKTLGMRLVITLAESQLQGKIELSRNNGTKYKITFPAGIMRGNGS